MFHVPNRYRLTTPNHPLETKATDGNNGVFILIYENKQLICIASDGEDWDHVSVSINNRCPNWREMCYVKDLFWDEEDTVIQYHPAKSEYVNNHPYCLHLWKPQKINISTPPSNLVGIKESEVK